MLLLQSKNFDAGLFKQANKPTSRNIIGGKMGEDERFLTGDLSPGANVIKLFLSVIYGFSY
jgi:hypothetical protein